MNLFRPLLLAAILLISNLSIAQDGSIKGKALDDETGEVMPFINVTLHRGDSVVNGATSDFDGVFSIKPLPPGRYNLKAQFVGYTAVEIRDIIVRADRITFVDVKMRADAVTLSEVEIVEYSVPLIDKDAGSSGSTITRADIRRMPARTGSADIASYMDGVPGVDGKKGKGSKDKISGAAGVGAGQLTAGEIHDFSKWKLWNDVSMDNLKRWQKDWHIRPQDRFTVQLTNPDGWPVVDQQVSLKGADGAVIWQSRTDNTGKAELWAGLFSDSTVENTYSIETLIDGKPYVVEEASAFQNGINQLEVPAECGSAEVVDVLFAVDATGSMSDEIAYLKAELNDVIGTVQKKHKKLKINLGSVFYRDHGDQYLTQHSDFSENIQQTIDFISKQNAGGGGDGPEAVEEALHVGIKEMNWSDEARARILFLVLDAPPHKREKDIQRINDLAALASDKGIRIVPVVASGMQKDGEYLMRSLALATNGTYTFLTDHSGIGNPHLKPTTDKYKVEKFNAMLVRLINQFVKVPKCDEPVDRTQENNELADDLSEAMQREHKVEKQKKRNIKVWPTPTNGPITVQLSHNAPELYITDITGKLLLRVENPQKKQKYALDLTGFPNGMYLVVAPFKEGLITKKVIMQY